MISFACAHCGAAVQAEDRLLGQFTTCPACRNAVPVPLPDVTAEPVAPPAEVLLAEPVALATPVSAEPSPFAYMDGTGGPTVISSRVAERAYGFYGKDALGIALAALVMSCIPCVSLGAPLLVILGLILSINGIIKCNGRSANGMGFSIAGLIVSVLAGGFWAFVLLANLVRAGAR